MKKLYLFIFIILFALSAVFALVQQDFSKVKIKSTLVAGNIYMLEGSGGNIGVSIGEDGVLIIDDQFAPLADKIKAAIKDLGGDAPKFILNTHWHGDHTGGNEAFSPEGTIIAQTNVRKRLMTKQNILGREIKPTSKEAWPIITFDASLSIHFNEEEIKAMHYPKGHTDGDAVIYFKGSNVFHLGDQWFNKLLPFVDLDSGGTVQGYMANIKKILDEIPDEIKIIPGHGALANKEDLRNFHRMLQETVSLVTEKMKSGKSLDDIKKEGLQEEWKSWSWSFISTERWIETIYKSYSKDISKK